LYINVEIAEDHIEFIKLNPALDDPAEVAARFSAEHNLTNEVQQILEAQIRE